MRGLAPRTCQFVMRGLGPRIHVFLCGPKDVDGRDKPGHDVERHGQK